MGLFFPKDSNGVLTRYVDAMFLTDPDDSSLRLDQEQFEERAQNRH